METISLHNTLPQVFSQRTDINSDIWKQDVIFEPQLKIVENLNKQTFTKNQLSSKSYYSKF